jgi:hypothetical protein
MLEPFARRDELPPPWQDVLADLEGQIAFLAAKLERLRPRAASARAKQAQIRGLWAENDRLRGIIRDLTEGEAATSTRAGHATGA